jgi:hypothetical protein
MEYSRSKKILECPDSDYSFGKLLTKGLDTENEDECRFRHAGKMTSIMAGMGAAWVILLTLPLELLCTTSNGQRDGLRRCLPSGAIIFFALTFAAWTMYFPNKLIQKDFEMEDGMVEDSCNYSSSPFIAPLGGIPCLIIAYGCMRGCCLHKRFGGGAGRASVAPVSVVQMPTPAQITVQPVAAAPAPQPIVQPAQRETPQVQTANVMVPVTIPHGMAPGQMMHIAAHGQVVSVSVPPGLSAGETMHVMVPGQGQANPKGGNEGVYM